MNIKVLETRDLFPHALLAEDSLLFRLLEIDGRRHLQFQGRSHDCMSACWAHGLLIRCPDTLTLDTVESDYLTYLEGHGDGCEVLDFVPPELSVDNCATCA